MRLGYASGGGLLLWKKLLPVFEQRYPPHFLEMLAPSMGREAYRKWMNRAFLANPCAQPPFRHLLLIDFLGLTAEEFFAPQPSLHPFGPGPWKCDNPVCSSYEEPVIQEIQCQNSNHWRRPMGILICPTCGRERTRIDGQTREYVRVQGRIWDAKLAELWRDPNLKLAQIAKILGVDARKVVSHAKKNNLPFPRLSGSCIIHAHPTNSKSAPDPMKRVLKERARWLELRQKYPTKSTTELARIDGKCHGFLKRHDRKWLESNRPALRKPILPQSRIDWDARDRDFAKRVPVAKDKLLRKPGLPALISKMALIRLLGPDEMIRKSLRKLPNTSAALAEAEESRIDLALRRLAWAAQKIRQEGASMTKWTLLDRAHVMQPVVYNDPRIVAAIQAELSR